MTLMSYQQSITEDWFASGPTFLAKAMLAPVTFPAHFPDSPTARGILLVKHFGLMKTYRVCADCGKPAQLRCTSRADRNGSFRFSWECPAGGTKAITCVRHPRKQCTYKIGPLAHTHGVANLFDFGIIDVLLRFFKLFSV